MNIEEVQRISEVSKREKWPYPRTFQELLGAGVISYRTSIASNHTVYRGAVSQYEETNDASVVELEVAELYQADAVKRGLAHHQRHRTPFPDFLRDMANAGVQFYEVNMEKRTINYTSGKPGESYVEAIPAVD
ncbi:hypothetical protein PAECIP111893_01244 [Paenibacillus plantiphilus]|uniref:Phage envelope protein n=1 Tax=Paenibacillus plantiphilus TaxID=2905650 RepID=A0ABM9BZ18_9BACL|nr:DUF1398 family protein [Paenibacillus plantiphilus]CAH1199151.1 hypothetical protein PAECIP111893_01244 [Paenibacillus plantiphilus]